MANNTSNNSASNFDSNKVCICGTGYVGTSLIEEFSKVFNVFGYDVSSNRVDFLTNYFKDKKNVVVSTDEDVFEGAAMFCIAVPTNLRVDNSIDDSNIKNAISKISKYAQPGSCIVMESSVSVGMTRALLSELHAKGVRICMSPERINPGMTIEAHTIPKILSGFDNESLECGKSFYTKVFDTIVPVSSLETAEFCKLYENCFRVINIAYTNECCDAAVKHGINPSEMINACSTKPFGFLPFQNSCGIGGHCLPYNSQFLGVNNDLPLLKFAAKNMAMRPQEKAHAFVKAFPDTNNVLVVGMGFKYGQSLTTNSPGLQYAQALKSMGKNVTVYDPLVNDASGLKMMTCDEWNVENLKKFDKIIVALRQEGVDLNILDSVVDKVVLPEVVV